MTSIFFKNTRIKVYNFLLCLTQKLESRVSKLFSFLRNKYYGIVFKQNIKRKAKYKIINHKEYINYLFKNGSISKKSILLNFTDGYRLVCRNNDLSAVGEACVLEDYQQMPKYQIHSGDIVFDIGAHIGTFSVYAATKGAMVYAFEPEDKNYKLLVQNIRLNKLEKNIVPFKLGIYKFNGKIPLFVSKTNLGGHSVIGEHNPKEIKVITLSGICQKLNIDRIDLLKIDAEGIEYDIFLNTPQNIFKIIDKVVGEYHLFINEKNLNFSYIKRLLKPYFKEIKHIRPYYFYARK